MWSCSFRFYGVQVGECPYPSLPSPRTNPLTHSVFGLIPRQLHGFLAQFRTMFIVGLFMIGARCVVTARFLPPRLNTEYRYLPSQQVLKAYETEGSQILLRAFNEPGNLEKLTGLDELHDS
jgi:ubiquitin-like modifier-activating enzyme ATG7